MKEYVNEDVIEDLLLGEKVLVREYGKKVKLFLDDDKHLMVEVYDDADRPYIGYAKEDGLVWDSPPGFRGVYLTSKFPRVLIHEVNHWLSYYI